MKLSYEGQELRAKKDTKPLTTVGGRNWRPVPLYLDGIEKEALIARYWLYFRHLDQWYKLDTRAAGIDPREVILESREVSKQTLDEKRARRQIRRRERRAAKKAASQTPSPIDYSEELEQ